jgi:tetratricopeptide (TPR) repeat protein
MEASANDTAKVKIMLKVIRTRTVKLGTDERIKLADSCIALADRLGYLKGKGNALLVKGELVLNSDNPNPYAGIESGYKALQIFEELKDVERQSQANQLLGWFYHVAKNNKEALVFTLKALEYGERTNNRKLMGGCYNNLGAIYHSMKDMKKSLRCYKMAASLSEELKNYPRLARTYGNISELLTELGKYDESMTYRNKAITLFREMDSRGGVIWHYAGLAEILIYKGLYDKALHYLDTVERFSVKDGWIELILNCYSVKEELFRRKGEFRNAYHYKTVYHRLDDSIAKANDVNKVSELKLFYEREKTEKIREMKDRMEAEKHTVPN